MFWWVLMTCDICPRLKTGLRCDQSLLHPQQHTGDEGDPGVQEQHQAGSQAQYCVSLQPHHGRVHHVSPADIIGRLMLSASTGAGAVEAEIVWYWKTTDIVHSIVVTTDNILWHPDNVHSKLHPDRLDEVDFDNCNKENDDIEMLFDLCKDDFPLSSKEQTVDVKKFLRELSQTGLQRDDPRLHNFIKELSDNAQEENCTSLDALKLNLMAFKRYIL